MEERSPIRGLVSPRLLISPGLSWPNWVHRTCAGQARATTMTLDRWAAHLVAIIRRITAVAEGLDPFSVPQEIDGLEPDGFVSAWEHGLEEQRQVWADDSVLKRPLVLPFATLPGSVALAIYISEVLVHTWDLATAIGVDVDWDDELALGALATMRFGLPAESRGDDVPFGPVVDVASTALSIDQLVGWLGRQP